MLIRLKQGGMLGSRQAENISKTSLLNVSQCQGETMGPNGTLSALRFILDQRVSKIIIYSGNVVHGFKFEISGADNCQKTEIFGNPIGTEWAVTLQDGETIKAIYLSRFPNDYFKDFICKLSFGWFQTFFGITSVIITL